MAYKFTKHNPLKNWFLTWDDESASDGKCILLQIKLHSITYRSNRFENPNIFATLYRRHNCAKTYTKMGTTSLIREDCNPEFSDGFRVYYDQQTDLMDDMLKVICFYRRDIPPSNEHVIGAASISLRELVRAFGTRINIELTRFGEQDKSCGGVWFYAEALPLQSPRGGDNLIQFFISSTVPPTHPTDQFRFAYQSSKMFVVVERERTDKTWGIAYRGEAVRKEGGIKQILSSNKSNIGKYVLKSFQLRQGELILGMTALRKIRFSFFQTGRKSGDPHTRVGSVVSSVDELINDFQVESSLDVKFESQVVGDFVLRRRFEEDHHSVSFDIHLKFYEQQDLQAMALERGQTDWYRPNSPKHLGEDDDYEKNDSFDSPSLSELRVRDRWRLGSFRR